ncbi:MAG: Coenzyme F420 hydrogenase/dehydrogenase, beta subunit C-terminal domain [Dehalococcoidales bacterium]|nr:MAG: Coenzyme F420 hydrogenase/dehydrogenase, beta subunit C-terminal domain [Dehalococcoidales bacterium]
MADISCGDAWLPEFAGDSEGTSIIVARTVRGEDILKRVAGKGYIDIKDISPDKVLASQPGFFFKKAHIRLFSWLTRIRGKDVPEYKTELRKLNAAGFFHALLQTLGPLLASRRYLWRFIPALNWINRFDST